MNKLCPLSDAVNAYTFTFDTDCLASLAALSQQVILPQLAMQHSGTGLDGGKAMEGVMNEGELSFYYTNSFSSSLFWVSCNNWQTYDIFKTFFDVVNIQDRIGKLVDFEKNIVMYCGFIMVNTHAKTENWHVDYFKGANAYTLITPLTELVEAHGGLIYSSTTGETKSYRYRLGEAVIFGEGFEHSTEPFEKAQQPRLLLSITLGTDKMQYWPVLRQTVGDNQSKFFVLPCGHQYGTCQCVVDSIGDATNAKALVWARSHINFYDYEIVCQRPWSQTLRLFVRDGGKAYLKILPLSRRHEASVSAALSQYFPGDVAKVLACEPESGWLLLADHKGQRHDSRSTSQALARVTTLARLEAQAVNLPELLKVVPRAPLHAAFQDICHCLWPERSPNLSGAIVNTYAHQFMSVSVAQNYWLALKKYEGFFTQWLNRLALLPLTLTHGDFQHDNAAELANGKTVLYDWGDAVLGPAGISLSNPLFLDDVTTAFRVLKNMPDSVAVEKNHGMVQESEAAKLKLDSQSEGKDQAYAELLERYVTELVDNGYGQRSAIIELMPASFLAGTMRWLVSWCAEKDYSQSLAKVAGRWWSATLDGLLELAKTYAPAKVENQNDARQSAQEDSAAVLSRLADWLKNLGAEFSAVEVKDDAGCRGIFTVERVPKNTAFISVPLQACLYNTRQHNAEINALLGSYPHLYDYMPTILRLATQLIAPNPYWMPYLASLPNEIDSLVARFPQPLKDALVKTAAWPEVLHLAKEYNEEMKHLKSRENALSAIKPGVFYWARVLYYTRSFRGKCFGWEDEYCFIPLIDMCNHATDANMSLSYNDEKGCFEAYAERDIEAGEEVTFYYGSKSNAYFLAHYGFTVEGNSIKALLLKPRKFCQEVFPEKAPLANKLSACIELTNRNEEDFLKLLSQSRALSSDNTTFQTWAEKADSVMAAGSGKAEIKTLKMIMQMSEQRREEIVGNEVLRGLCQMDKNMSLTFNELNLQRVCHDELALLSELDAFCKALIKGIEKKQSSSVLKNKLQKHIFGKLYLALPIDQRVGFK